MLQSCQPNLRKYKTVQYTSVTYIIQGFQSESKETVYLIYYLPSVYSKQVLKSLMNIQHKVLHCFQVHSSSRERSSFLLTSLFKKVLYLLLEEVLIVITGCNFFFQLTSNRTTHYFLLYQRKFSVPRDFPAVQRNSLEEKWEHKSKFPF